MATRGQVRRALEWERYLAISRYKRKHPPPCVTCGAAADGEHARGQPRYTCQHESLRIDDETLERGRRELR